MSAWAVEPMYSMELGQGDRSELPELFELGAEREERIQVARGTGHISSEDTVVCAKKRRFLQVRYKTLYGILCMSDGR